MKRLIVVGSPRSDGRSAHLAEMLFEAHIDEHPEDELFLVPLSEIEVGPCIACNACCEKMPVILKDDEGKEVTVERHRCVFDDDMQTVYDLLDDADELTVVSPIFFSGAPAQMKCLLDRLQPYYWASDRGKAGAKHPASLHVIGEGGDPHGYDALVSEVKSALAVAGFRLERVLDWVGKIDEDGEITAEAKEVRFNSEGGKQRPKLNLTSSVGLASSSDERAPRQSGEKASKQVKAKSSQARRGSGKGGQARGKFQKGKRHG